MSRNQPYPSRAHSAAMWRDLARKAHQAHFEEPDNNQKGELIVVGSGLTSLDFLRDVRREIDQADEVFFCVTDPVTQAWIRSVRPDAFDMNVLYSEASPRYSTYIQMAEVMLYPVRQGRRSLAIYYGHPGVFAMPTHRALMIARREGHRAKMRPGVSALDYLVADLGFDPAFPGLLSYEASDMLLRKRQIDPSLHVVLWQVGVVAEFGFQRQGFRNEKFEVLVDLLERHYGPDWEITHYIAPRFPHLDPIIEKIRVRDWRDPDVAARVTALSTFYIEPRVVSETDEAVAVNLGLAAPGGPLPPPYQQTEIARYGHHEKLAIEALAQFEVPEGYHHQADTPGVRFMIALAEDPALQRLFRQDPEEAIACAAVDGMTEETARLLVQGTLKGVQAAIGR